MVQYPYKKHQYNIRRSQSIQHHLAHLHLHITTPTCIAHFSSSSHTHITPVTSFHFLMNSRNIHNPKKLKPTSMRIFSFNIFQLTSWENADKSTTMKKTGRKRIRWANTICAFCTSTHPTNKFHKLPVYSKLHIVTHPVIFHRLVHPQKLLLGESLYRFSPLHNMWFDRFEMSHKYAISQHLHVF